VTGGVVSSLGKGIAAASLGNLLRARGLTVSMTKMDPYLNLDPGTMNPYEHGEVFVTCDGAETDLDLGHYERFTDVPCTQSSTHAQGRIYEDVLRREREGEFLGKTVQIIPHITDEIKRRITAAAENVDVAIIEIGGTVGDIESQPFLEAVRQMRRQIGMENMCFVHLTYAPYIAAAGELKTKPTQQSVSGLRQTGLIPDVLLVRSEQPLPSELKQKIAVFCDLPDNAVISGHDARDIYEVPLLYHAQGLDRFVCNRLRLECQDEPDLTEWRSFCERILGSSVPVKVAVVGKYIEHQDAYLSIRESLRHAAAAHHRALEIEWVDAESVTDQSAATLLADVDAILVPGGFGARGVDGKIAACRYARMNGVPFLGICLGLQMAVVEFARNAARISGATSREFTARGRNCVIDLSAEQRGVRHKGGTMRLGEQAAQVVAGTLLHRLYGAEEIRERHRHRFEVAERFVPQLEAAGLVVSARHPERGLVECIELPQDMHPFYVAAQYHPELSSRPTRPHPLFAGLIQAAIRG
jgi:CTP synthase